MIWLVALASFAAQDKVQVTVNTRDGNVVTGWTEMKSITVQSSLGKLELKLSVIVWIASR